MIGDNDDWLIFIDLDRISISNCFYLFIRAIRTFKAQEELWLECAQRLTAVIQQIIEFAKMVPGFMKLSQDDQIVLLKTGISI